jgi:DNA polymerase-1
MTPITDLIGKGKTQITMAQVAISDAAAYAGADGDMTLRLADLLEPSLRDAGLWDLFANVEMPLVPVLVDMEMAGVALDVPFLKRMSMELAERIATIEDEIYANAGHRFNINSTQQLAGVLFSELGLPSARKTKTGHSTDADTLDALRGAHPIIQLILDHRQLVKLKSTYVDALPIMVNPRTGRVHTSFNQTGTTTGRVSSSDPNLQNIPIRTEIGREVRRAFVAGQADQSLMGADYSQVELRIMAHVAGDETLISAFEAGEDIHRATASELFGVPIGDVNSDQRRIAKTTNFGVVYGISDYGLSQQLGIPRKDAGEFIQRYFARYPSIRGYLDSAVKQARDTGYVTTLMGRRRHIPEIHVANQTLRNAAERMAINMPIQGTAADIIKLAMIRLHHELKARGLASRMVLQVHDELVLEGPDSELAEVESLVSDVMSGAFKLSVPLKVDVATGKSWADLD